MSASLTPEMLRQLERLQLVTAHRARSSARPFTADQGTRSGKLRFTARKERAGTVVKTMIPLLEVSPMLTIEP